MPGPSNHLLDALPPAEFERLRPHLDLIDLPLGRVIYEPGGHLQHALFPTTCILSLHYVMATGASAETTSVGSEGMVGIPIFMGGDTTSSSCMVQTAGQAWRLDRVALKQEFLRGEMVRGLLLSYTQAVMNRLTQTAACNRHHNVDQQLCRWLLLNIDRVSGRELVTTQEFVAGMLGVRRESITVAAGLLQSAGVISYRRGHISVLDRKGLESRACECYAVDRRELARLESGKRYRQRGDGSEDSKPEPGAGLRAQLPGDVRPGSQAAASIG